MKTNLLPARRCVLLAATLLAAFSALAERQIPGPLQEWQDWALWDARHRDCPTPFNDATRHVCFWPGELSLSADAQSATWQLQVTVFAQTWVPLPGGAETWPVQVRGNGAPLAVVEHEGRPSVELLPGHHLISGTFEWEEQMPQRIGMPPEVGILSLVLEGRTVEIPNRDDTGALWLKRDRVEPTDKDAVSVQVWRLIEDGIPLWLRTEIELSVSGKSREEVLGNVVPEGWRITAVDAPVPVAVDDQGLMKAQVRAGKWTLRVDAFRTTDAGEIRFAPDAQPVAPMGLVGFRALPEFRMAELEGLPVVDVSQTTFPNKWRNLPVYQWDTTTSFRLVEKMRGMGLQKPEGLKIARVLWLDEDGQALTFRDQIRGNMQQIWRLDIAEGQDLGAAKIGGQAQLITTNPATGAHGLEIRARNLDLQAIGRSDRVREMPATGWRSSADALQVTLNLPPGWRLFALFGADRVNGDWLTAWTLLDLFLLLIFSLAVFKLWGVRAGVLAFIAFGLSYHEPGAPRLTWLFLLLPLALLRVVPEGGLRKGLMAWRYLAIALLLLCLVPFVARQIQGALYPQLEPRGTTYGASRFFGAPAMLPPPQAPAPSQTAQVAVEEAPAAEAIERRAGVESYAGISIAKRALRSQMESNLRYDSKAKIQTGPAEPEWSWNTVSCSWNSPVSANETIRPVFISLTVHRLLSVLRVGLLLLLGGILFRSPGKAPLLKQRGAASVAALTALLALAAPLQTSAQLPDAQLLDSLRERLLKPSDAFPHAAEIAAVELTVTDGSLSMMVEVHAAVDVAVPLPGKMPAWSPVSVQVDGAPEHVLRRDAGYLWVVVPSGVHRLAVQGLLPKATEWEWTFLLKPRRVSIQAPGWTVTGVRPNGVPENQVFFARQRKTLQGEAEYDRKDFNAIVVLDRHLEVGLVWQARQVVTRLSPPGKAIALRIPLLQGEQVLSPNVMVENGYVEVRLGAGEKVFTWESQLREGEPITLTAEDTDRWVERWHLVTSPVWNAELSGLAPVFETNEENLVPVWHPWPGERVKLSFRKPEAVSGDTVTVRRVRHEMSLGSRQRNSTLTLNLEASLGDEFIL
jgi:hypothetical protein